MKLIDLKTTPTIQQFRNDSVNQVYQLIKKRIDTQIYRPIQHKVRNQFYANLRFQLDFICAMNYITNQ